jgi:hypothetical protein
VAHCWVLKGQPRALVGVVVASSVPGSDLVCIPLALCVWGLVEAVGFGVRWGVCELDSGCEHLILD